MMVGEVIRERSLCVVNAQTLFCFNVRIFKLIIWVLLLIYESRPCYKYFFR